MFDEFVKTNSRPLRRSIRVNTLKVPLDEFCQRVSNLGWQLSSIPWCHEGYWLEREHDEVALGNAIEHLGGMFYIQEASSMLPVSALFHFLPPDITDPVLLDAAAAPGSKTTQMAARLNRHGAIVANEFSASRIKSLYSNLQRCGVSNAALTHYNANVFGKWLPEAFDGILLDAPCSGEGTLRKDPHALDNWSLEHVEEIAALQRELIESAFQALKPGGTLIYSTCTLNHRENSDVVASLMENHPEAVEIQSLAPIFVGSEKALTQEGFLHVWPQFYDCEGFFIAAIKKLKSVESPEVVKKLKPLPFEPASNKQKQVLESYLKSQFGLELTQGQLMVRDNEYWLFPVPLLPLLAEIRFDRIGIKVAEQFKKEFRLTHEAASRFAAEMTQDKFELSIEQATQYIQGRDISWPDAKQGAGEVVLMCQGNLLGLGKQLKGKIKNRLPRELVRDNVAFN